MILLVKFNCCFRTNGIEPEKKNYCKLWVEILWVNTGTFQPLKQWRFWDPLSHHVIRIYINAEMKRCHIRETTPFPNNKSGKFALSESPCMLSLPSITYQCFDDCSSLVHTCPRSKASRMCHSGGRWGPHWGLKAEGIAWILTWTNRILTFLHYQKTNFSFCII